YVRGMRAWCNHSRSAQMAVGWPVAEMTAPSGFGMWRAPSFCGRCDGIVPTSDSTSQGSEVSMRLRRIRYKLWARLKRLHYKSKNVEALGEMIERWRGQGSRIGAELWHIIWIALVNR